MGIASVRLVQAGCPSCHPTDSVGPCSEDKGGVTNNRAGNPGRTAFQLRAVIADINHHTTAQSRKWQRRQRLTGSGDIAARQQIRLLSVRNKKKQETKRNRLGYIQSDAWRFASRWGRCTVTVHWAVTYSFWVASTSLLPTPIDTCLTCIVVIIIHLYRLKNKHEHKA